METSRVEQYVKDLRFNLTLVQVELVCLDITSSRHESLLSSKAKLISSLDSLYKQIPNKDKSKTRGKKKTFTIGVN